MLNPWGTVPVDATIAGVTWYTSMFPRDKGRYYDLPLKLKIIDQSWDWRTNRCGGAYRDSPAMVSNFRPGGSNQELP